VWQVLDPREQVQLGAGGAGVSVFGGQLHLPVQHRSSADWQVARGAARGQRALAVGAAGREGNSSAAAAARPPLPHHPLPSRKLFPPAAQYLRSPFGRVHLLPGLHKSPTPNADLTPDDLSLLIAGLLCGAPFLLLQRRGAYLYIFSKSSYRPPQRAIFTPGNLN